MQKKRFGQNDEVNFKNCNVTTWLITILMHILTNISRGKGNQAMKFGQLVEYNIENIFVKIHTQNVLEKLFPDLFLKNQN